MKVYKYPLQYTKFSTPVESGSTWEQVQRVDLPWSYEVLRVDLQGDSLVLWAKVDTDDFPNASVIMVNLEIVGTGQSIQNPSWEYLNTFFDNGLVFHVFVDQVKS